MSPAGGGMAGGSVMGLTERLVALRGELWQRHALLRGMDREDVRYEDASSELIELTSALLRAEADVAELVQAARRRISLLGAAVATVLLLAAVALFFARPVIGVLTSRVATGAVLLAVIVTLLVTVLLGRRRRGPAVPRRGPAAESAEPGRPEN